jgi:hypothetical protein
MMPLLELIKQIQGMTPAEFEAYCENNDIANEWMDVNFVDFNDGVYNVYLPEYEVYAFAMNGSVIEIA